MQTLQPSVKQVNLAPRLRRRTRKGTSTIEFAIVAIPLFVLVMASIEFGRGMMAVQSLEEAARCGCRRAVLKGSTTADVEAEVTQMMNLVGISAYTTQIEPAALATVPQWNPVTVRVSANLGDVSWLPMPKYMSGLSYTASCVLAREGAPD
jgi:Flp pilus assembly protein TadG